MAGDALGAAGECLVGQQLRGLGIVCGELKGRADRGRGLRRPLAFLRRGMLDRDLKAGESGLKGLGELLWRPLADGRTIINIGVLKDCG